MTEVDPTRVGGDGDTTPAAVLPTSEHFDAYGWEYVLGEGFNLLATFHGEAPDRDQIAEVTHFWSRGGDYAETDMAALLRLRDGSWAAVVASCDTTGWDCIASIDWTTGVTRERAIGYGLDQAARRHLDLALPGEDLDGGAAL